MRHLVQLSELIKARNLIEQQITAITGRPASIGHIGEYIASVIFDIALEESASHKSIDGRFRNGPLENRTVNVKWYALHEGSLDLSPNALPDCYLVLAGPKSSASSSRGQARPWSVDHVFLFDAAHLVNQLKLSGVKIGVATSVRQSLWENAEIYPKSRSTALVLSPVQRDALILFHTGAHER